MARQGVAIDRMLTGLLPGVPKGTLRILDVAAGIGTQALPLAGLGYQVTARDVSPVAIARLGKEACTRGLTIDAAPSDMRCVSDSVQGAFHAVLAFDNCIPHLLTDGEIVGSLSNFREVLAPGGAVLLSVRDYEQVDMSAESSHPYGERTRGGRKYRVQQDWKWLGSRHYRTAMVVEEYRCGEWCRVSKAEAQYYAISIPRLLEMLEEVGFLDCRRSQIPFFQPVLMGRAPA
jgi:SAM-dependent methyltransferase